jgi:Ni/Co efflux regulator RcnB
MKKFIIAALAASIIATPAMAAPGQNRGANNAWKNQVEQRHDNRAPQYRPGQHRVDQRQFNKRPVVVRHTPQVSYRSWKKGERFDSRYARNYRVISQPRGYGLRAAPSGHRWVQSGNDALLIGITSGIVSAIASNIIR